MKGKERIIVHPYDSHFTPVLRNTNFLNEYDIVGVSSLTGWGFSGKDAGLADGGNLTGIIVEKKFDVLIELCDTVLFLESDLKCSFELNIYPQIMQAINAGKNIICTLDLKEKYKEIYDACMSKSVNFNYLRKSDASEPEYLNKPGKISDISTPIIAVISVTEGANKFAIQLSLRDNIQKMGYKVSQVGTRNYCELLDFHSFPEFMSSGTIPEYKKVLLFNEYIKNIEVQEEPDVIIVGIPGAIMPFNNDIHNGFGILAYEVFQAINPDASILSLLYEDYKAEYFDILTKKIRYQFGFDVDGINITNKKVDWMEMMNNKTSTIRTLSINTDFVNKKVKEFNNKSDIPVFNILDDSDSKSMAQVIINKLEGNANIKII
ncbi:MAG: TIGR04066 family peptide maturation system protein [Clostridia bacterium]|nr:TIGR04066 family peptide maturation system protein [Clostridia bacterium]